MEVVSHLPPRAHVVFLHDKFRKCSDDQYLIDMAVALEQQGHIVSIYASELDEDSSFDDMIDAKSNLEIKYSGWWVPSTWKCFRSAVMAFRMSIFPPTPLPTVVIMDINSIAIYVLTILRNFKLIYVPNFSALQQADIFSEYIRFTPDLVSTKALKHAHEIIVPSEGHVEVFRRSFPLVYKPLRIVHPCVDTGAWKAGVIDIMRIIPDLESPCHLFVCFGPYRKRSNFKLVLEALEDLFLIVQADIKNNIRLVIAGHCSELNPAEIVHYNELQDFTKEQSYASQVTFIRHLPTVYMKTLISECTGVIVPCKYELNTDTILAAMACKKAIIATNSGFAKEALRHRFTALLVGQSPQLFAAAMYKLLNNRGVQVFISSRAHEQFNKKYCNGVFQRKINAIVHDSIEAHLLELKTFNKDNDEHVSDGPREEAGDHIQNNISEEDTTVEDDEEEDIDTEEEEEEQNVVEPNVDNGNDEGFN